MSAVERVHGLDSPFHVRGRHFGNVGLFLLLGRSGELVARRHAGVMVRGFSDAGVQELHEDVRSSSGGGRSPNKSGRAAEAIASSQPSFWIGFRKRAKRDRFWDPFLNAGHSNAAHIRQKETCADTYYSARGKRVTLHHAPE